MLNIPTLRDKAITVRLSRRMYNPYKYDKTATEAAENSTGTHRAGRFTKRLLRNCVELKKTQSAYNDLYAYVVDNTLPWMDDGVRVLPNANYMEFVAEVGNLRRRAAACLKVLYDAWDQRVMEDQKILGGLWCASDYLSKDEMLGKWGVQLTFAPVPCSEDFRIDMDETDKQALDEAVREVQDQAGDYLLKEILKPVAAMAEKLAVPIGTEGSIFRDTLVSNLKDVCKRARKLNINGDSRVASVISDIEAAVSVVTPDSLRQSTAARQATGSAMKAVEKKINQWF